MSKIYNKVDRHELNKITLSWDTVLLKFGAPWCVSCKTLDQTLGALADETEGFAIAKVDVEDYPELAGQYEIMSVPTMFILKNGLMEKKIVGSKSLDELKRLIGEVKGE